MQILLGRGLGGSRSSITKGKLPSYKPHSTWGAVLVLELFLLLPRRPADRTQTTKQPTSLETHRMTAVGQKLLVTKDLSTAAQSQAANWADAFSLIANLRKAR